MFDQNFNFLPKFLFLTKISIFTKIFFFEDFQNFMSDINLGNEIFVVWRWNDGRLAVWGWIWWTIKSVNSSTRTAFPVITVWSKTIVHIFTKTGITDQFFIFTEKVNIFTYFLKLTKSLLKEFFFLKRNNFENVLKTKIDDFLKKNLMIFWRHLMIICKNLMIFFYK